MRPILIFSGFNTRGVIAFLRSAIRLSCSVRIVALTEQDPILLTTYREYVGGVRASSKLEIENVLEYVQQAQESLGERECLLLPSSEYLNRFFLTHRDVLESRGCRLPLVEGSLYSAISDKQSFGDLCSSHGLAIPEEVFDINYSEVPLVAKPRTYQLQDGSIVSPELLVDEDSFSRFMKTKAKANYYFQRFISGESYYLLYYVYRDGKIVSLSQQNLLQQPNGKSILAARISSIHREEIGAAYEGFLRKLGFFGFIMIEIRKTLDGCFAIEANPRLWGPSQLFVDAGRDLFHDFLFDWRATSLPPEHSSVLQEAKYFWLGGFRASQSPTAISLEGADANMLNGLHEFLEHDVYKRRDTMDLFIDELGVQ